MNSLRFFVFPCQEWKIAFRYLFTFSILPLLYPFIFPFFFPLSAATSVLASGGLAGLELLEVPAADLHVARVVVHALGEVLRGARAVVAPLALVRVLLVRLRVDLLRSGLGRRGGAAAEETADGVADGGAYRDTAVTVVR